MLEDWFAHNRAVAEGERLEECFDQKKEFAWDWRKDRGWREDVCVLLSYKMWTKL